jgi:hypothetical protein
MGAAGSTAAGTTVGAGGIGGAAGGTGLTAATLGGAAFPLVLDLEPPLVVLDSQQPLIQPPHRLAECWVVLLQPQPAWVVALGY